MKFAEVMEALERHKGDGTWNSVSKLSGVSYCTIARIARGALKKPSVQSVEQIADAIRKLGLIRKKTRGA